MLGNLLILVSMCPCKKSLPIQKNLETYLMILISMCPYKKSGNVFNHTGINK